MRLARAMGFSLLELMTTLAVVVILAGVAVPAYREHLLQARLAEARVALLENNHFMQRWYADHGSFQAESPTNWPTLPITETRDFEITFSSKAPSLDNIEHASFLIHARPKLSGDWSAQLRLTLDQDGNIRYCDRTEASPKEVCTVF